MSEAFRGEPIGLRPTTTDGRWTIHYCGEMIGSIDMHAVAAGEASRTFSDARPRPRRGEAAIGGNDAMATGPE